MSFVEAALSNEEDWLWHLVRYEKDQRARNQLVEIYLPYARQIAASLFARRPDDDVEFADYLQYASIGLIEAVDRYETTKGAMFKTFAGYRIKGAIINGVNRATEKREQYAKVSRHKNDRLKSIVNTKESNKDNALFLEMVELTVGLALGFMLDDLLEDRQTQYSKSGDPYRGYAYEEISSRVRLAVEQLNERERRVIQYHYYHQVGFESLADLNGVTKGRISQMHKEALGRIRSSLQIEGIVDKFY